MIRFRIPAARECIATIALGLAAGNAIAPHVHGQSGYAVHELPAGKHPGIAVGLTKSTWVPGVVKRYPNPRANGLKGIIFKGQGVDQTFIEMDDWGFALRAGNDCGNIVIRDCTIVASGDGGIKYQEKKGDWKAALDSKGVPIPGAPQVWKSQRTKLYPDSMLTLVNVRLAVNKWAPQWFIDLSNVDLFMSNVVVDASCAKLGEHIAYVHGVANKGIWLEHVYVYGAGAEIIKVPTREWEAHFAPNAALYATNCSFRGFGAKWGGAVFSMQGSGLQRIEIVRCILEGRLEGTRPVDRLLGLGDGLSTRQNQENNARRCYDIETGLPAGSAPAGWLANGDVIVRECAWLGYGGNPVCETYTGYPGYEAKLGIADHDMARSVTITDCVLVDGNGTANGTAAIKLFDVRDNNVTVEGCNTSELLQAAANVLGWNMVTEMQVYSRIGGGAASTGVSK